MPTLPKAEDVTKAREQATQTLGDAAEQARTPLLAALGAGDLATQAVRDTLKKVRSQLNERAESAKAGVNDLPSDLGELREKLDPAELRKVVDAYTQSALKLYNTLAERGEETLERLRSQPQVQRAWSQMETAQDRFGGLADDVLGRVSRSTRSFGEKAARAAEKTAESTAETVERAGQETAETVRETGAKAATTTRSTARKTASRATAARSTGRSTTSKSTES